MRKGKRYGLVVVAALLGLLSGCTNPSVNSVPTGSTKIVYFSPDKASIHPGQSVTFQYEADNSTDCQIAATDTQSSSTTIQVNCTGSRSFTPTSSTTYQFSAEKADKSGWVKSSQVTISVVVGTVSSVSVAGPTEVTTGGSTSYAATVAASGGASSDVKWASSDPSIASVSSQNATTANVFANSPGDATLTATSTADPSQSGSLVLHVLATTPTTWTDNFESYALGTFPSTWIPNANAVTDTADNQVVLDPTNGTNKVLQIYGTDPGNWSALAFRACQLTPSFQAHARIYVDSYYIDSVGRVSMQLKTGTDWTDPGTTLVYLRNDNNVFLGNSANPVTTFAFDTWHNVTVSYNRTGGSATFQMSFDNVNYGPVTMPVSNIPQEASMAYLDFNVRGGVLVDDVSCTPQ